MPAFKIRRKGLFVSKFRLGKLYGTWMKNILSGSVSITAPCLTAGSFENATATIAELTTSHKIFLSGCLSACELILHSARVTAASILTVEALNAGSANTTDASPMTVHYFALIDLA